MIAIAIIGWLVAGALIWWVYRRTPTDTQLQHTSRDYARARQKHRAQMDAVRHCTSAFEKADDFSDLAVIAFLSQLRELTTERG